MLRMIRILIVALLVVSCTLLRAGLPLVAGDDDERLQRDLERLKGRWERIVPDSQPQHKEILFVQGDKELFSVEDLEGKVVRRLTARIRLETEGDVGIYTLLRHQACRGRFSRRSAPEVSVVHLQTLHGSTARNVRATLRPDRFAQATRRMSSGHSRGPSRKPSGATAPIAAADPVADDPETKRDLEMLQGRWERISRDAEGKITFSQEKLVEGNEETLTNRNADGKIVHRHTVKFRLEKHGPVRVYNFYEITVYPENGAQETAPADYSFVYKFDGKSFLDAPGLFWSRPTYLPNPALHTWVRPGTKE